MKRFLAFEYKSGPCTTEGEPNKKTGWRSTAGALHCFKSKTDRTAWVAAGEVTPHMRSNCRVSVGRLEARRLCRGMTVEQYENYLDVIDK